MTDNHYFLIAFLITTYQTVQKDLKRILVRQKSRLWSNSTNMEKRNRSVTVAIDFGTTFSGFGFAEANVLGEAGIQVFRGWGRGQGFSFYKTPTCVLLNPDRSFSKFGHAAVETYTKHLAKGSNKDFIYFERFKLVLYNTKVSRNSCCLFLAHGCMRLLHRGAFIPFYSRS